MPKPGGDGRIVVYNGGLISPAVFAHEAGHNLATQTWGSTRPFSDSDYGKAQAAEKPVSSYGENSPSEDFAEACAMYATDRAALEANFPRKFAALEKLLS